MKLGIIGTAGRGPDGDKLTVAHWNMMCFTAMGLYHGLKADSVVSGGAAWADAVAVKLYIEGLTSKLSLHLPADFDKEMGRFVCGQSSFDTGRTSNFYHEGFSRKLGIDSLSHIGQAILKCDFTIGSDFKSRNTLVANESDALLAFTFGHGPLLKDGGTKDTMDKFLKKRGRREDGPLHPGHRAFHFDLGTKKLFEI